MAWLHAVPDKQPPKERRRSRYSTLKSTDSPLCELPTVESHGHLLRWLVELGITGHGMSGPIPLSWSDVFAWSMLTGTDVPPDEVLQLMQLSRTYCEQFSASKDPTCPSPIQPQSTDDALNNQFEQILSQVL